MHMAPNAAPLAWTLEQLDRLPDDGNRYELVRGELFVTPAPSPAHERIVVVLSEILVDYVRQQRIGRVFHPRAVVRVEQSEVEPDVMVRPWTPLPLSWEEAPLPLLVLEVLSGITRRRDYGPKRALYVDIGIPDYWIVDGNERTIRAVRPGIDDVVANDVLVWLPAGAADPLTLDVRGLFEEALGPGV
jgi:Uma2 family endonuclease